MRHSTCRAAIADHELSPAAQDHIASCAECAKFAAAVTELDRYAPSLAPGPAPQGLEEKTLARIASGPGAPVAAATLIPRSWRRLTSTPRTRGVLALASAACAALVVLGALVLAGRSTSPPSSSPAQVLAVAVRQLAATGTARLRLHATSQLSVTLPHFTVPALPAPGASVPGATVPSLPEVPGVPPAVQGQLNTQLGAFQRSLQQWEQQLAQAARNGAVGAVEGLPSHVSASYVVEGTGEVAEPDQLQLQGTVAVEHSSLPTGAGPYSYELVVAGGHAYMRQANGDWLEVPGPAGPLGPMVLDPSAIPIVLGSPNGTVNDLGVTTVGGDRVRHLRFGVRPGALPGEPAGMSLSADVWTGVKDHLVRRLVLASSGAFGSTPGVQWNNSVELDLSDFGLPVHVSPPPASSVTGTLSLGSGPGAILYPFPTGVSFSSYFPSVGFGAGAGNG